MTKSLYIQFHQHSQDFLRLLGDKSRDSERSKTAQKELGILEFFWDGIDEIFKKYEQELHELRLLCANEHAKGILLTKELKSTYNELYKIRHKIPVEIAAIMAKTIIPNMDDLKQDVIVK